MFGLLDYLFSKFSGYGVENKGVNPHHVIKRFKGKKKGPLYIYFFPQSTYDPSFLNKKYVLEEFSSLEYRINTATICPDPRISKKILNNIFNDSLKEAKKAIRLGREVNILGLSLGVTLAVKLANRIKTNKLVLVIGGSSLPKCIEEGVATRQIFFEGKKRGFSRRDFERSLGRFSPINNMRYLDKKMKTLVVLAKHDKIIPYASGKILRRELFKRLDDVVVFESRFCGHCMTSLLFRKDLIRSNL